MLTSAVRDSGENTAAAEPGTPGLGVGGNWAVGSAVGTVVWVVGKGDGAVSTADVGAGFCEKAIIIP